MHHHFFLYVILLLRMTAAFALRNDSVMCKEREREALLNIKHDLIDDNDYLSSWGSEEHERECCKWFGITCNNRTGHVTELILRDMQLRGKISPSLLVLRHLISLDLTGNDFGGTQFPIDPKNASLSKLALLYLYDANFGGTIAPVLRNLSSLQHLIIGKNHFYDIGNSNWISGHSSLVVVCLCGIPLVKPNDWLETVNNKLFHLQELWLRSCFSEYEINTLTLPPINSSSDLKYIALAGNNLVIPSIHPWLSNITHNIQLIDLSSNILKPSALADFHKMFSLQCLILRNTTLEGSLQKYFGNMSGLSYLDLSWNLLNVQLVDLIQSLSGPTESSLELLDLSNSHIKGPLSNDLSKFSSLLQLFLGNNKLNGRISNELISNLFKLQVLVLSNNLLFDVIPNCFENMQNLQILDLGDNNFSREIPPSIGFLFNLEVLILKNNKLSRELPFSLKNFARLIFIDLSHNQLLANISTWIEKSQSSLRYLNIGSNQFYGTMPLELCQMKNVQVLDLSENNISGIIPYCLNNLRAFSVGKSNATVIDRSPIFSTKPHFLFLSYYMARAAFIWKGLKLESGENLGRFRIIDFSSNKLVGPIPREMATLSSLRQLNLSHNALTGVLPEDINDLKQLESLDVSCNHLSGKLPSSMSDLNFLSTLNVSYNNFSGIIPSSTQLQSFDASAFSDNPSLCGAPLQKMCPGDDIVQDSRPTVDEPEDQDDEFVKSLYMGMGIGFAVAFWGVSGTLLLKRSIRHGFFKFLDELGDQVYVTIVLFKNRLLKIKDRFCS